MDHRPIALALDLGSTRFKLGVLHASGKLEAALSAPAPALRGQGLIREGSPQQFLTTANKLIDEAATRWPGLPLGLVSQRSTFCVWDKATGAALSPMISWQDRRAAGWCALHPELQQAIAERSGLLLSPHYLGPKLAALQEAQPELAAALHSDRARAGTLDAWLMWHWSGHRRHQTDLTMAARTALVDIRHGNWSSDLCQVFTVPVTVLPTIRPTDQQSLPLPNGLELKASIADQGAGAIAVLHPDADAALVNFGTGAFVLRPSAGSGTRLAGYLTGPVLDAAGEAPRFVQEGTINGAGPALDRFHSGPTELPAGDDCPEGFAIPDLAGVGAPHWREDVGLTLSGAAQGAAAAIKRRIVLEGLLFRVVEILIGLGAGQMPAQVLISGGAVRDPAIGAGLAQLLDQPVRQLLEPESTLLGAARLAAGRPPYANPATREIMASAAGAYLPAKYERWQSWLRDVLGSTPRAPAR